jgi:hypothetical protein
MSKRDGIKKAVKFFKDVDDICQIVTGKKLAQIGARFIDAYGDEIGKKIDAALGAEEEELAADNPYRILHCRPDADDLVIRGKYRLLVKELHPVSGDHPDEIEFRRVTDAYNQIKNMRENIDK